MTTPDTARTAAGVADLVAIAALAPSEALVAAHGGADGLSAAESADWVRRYDPNTIAREGRPSVLAELTRRAMNPLNALLLGLAALSYFSSDGRSAEVIALIVVLRIDLGFTQEHRSAAATTKLATMVRIRASVTRTGEAVHLPTPGHGAFFETPLDKLAPGDTVRPSACDMIPADV